MRTSAHVDIRRPPKAVWDVVTDIEHAAATIPAIQKVEILERPKGKLVGLKWKETRTMFGKSATEVIWITSATPRSIYETRAESHGAIYTTRVSVRRHEGQTRLSMEFEGTPVSLGAKVSWGLMGFLFKGATRKAIQKDLDDIKRKLESTP